MRGWVHTELHGKAPPSNVCIHSQLQGVLSRTCAFSASQIDITRGGPTLTPDRIQSLTLPSQAIPLSPLTATYEAIFFRLRDVTRSI